MDRLVKSIKSINRPCTPSIFNHSAAADAAAGNDSGASFHVLSVSWCPDLIATATGLPRETITCNSLEVDPGTGR